MRAVCVEQSGGERVCVGQSNGERAVCWPE